MRRMDTSDFATLVQQRFVYLATEYAFTFRFIDSGYVRFEQPELEINFLWGKGELDTVLQVRREDAVFRPYKSRQFVLHEVVRTIDPAAYERRPDLPSCVMTLEDVDRHLLWQAALLQSHCAPILKGDFAVLKSIYLQRAE